ncbi:synergin gamma-like isoform X3 [Penaeus japonicus]|uniref:synergin gamma-like isoform X3 n=1 Tax=Penaeus japonicus TaxID=27405 RepID=UPI001C70BC70|nr:synergin gamma-like isoform X3 [Penaeus japonicus]
MSNSASNIPIRPGQMPAAGAGVRNAGPVWGLGMGMPPLGFGVVQQQPGNMMMGGQVQQMAPQVANWQQQQFMAAQQMGLSGATVGVQPMPQQQQHLQQQYQQHLQQKQYQQQQQWAEAQKKVAEEQKKMYEQIMKQRQFDEQKMRLQAFSSSKKMPVSADSMIENILGTKDMPKPKSPPAPPKKIGNATSEEKMANTRQGTAVDWSKMADVDTLFVASQNNSVQSPAGQPVGGFNAGTAPVSHMPSESTPGLQPEVPFMTAPASTPGMAAGVQQAGVSAGGPPTMPQQMTPQGPPMPPPAGGAPVMAVPCDTSADKGGSSKTLSLPDWLSDRSALPAVYLQARSLVEGSEGWVDTSRAYMLLMKTGLPPPFLGVLWEMVNKTKPGHLRDQEFTALLALVALVQCGQTITNAEILSSTQEPVLPIIDHPALLPLVQDYVQQRQQQLHQQQQQQMQQQQQQDGSQKQSTASVTTPVGVQPNIANNVDDDEFDDFVGPPPTSVPTQVAPMNPPQSAGVGHPPPQTNVAPPATANQKPVMPAVDKIKRMNLPELGSSPEQSPSVSFDHSHDDDFDDFQSATITSAPPASMTSTPAPQSLSTTASVSSNFSAPPLLQPEKSGDKYAVFRQLETPAQDNSMGSLHHQPPPNAEEPNFGDESFGDFCSSEPASLTASVFPPITPAGGSGGPTTNNTTPVSFEVFSTPPEMIPESSTGAMADNHFEADFGVFASASMQPADNYADIHEAMKRVEAEQKLKEASNWSDPFGEFEEAPSASTGKAIADFGSKSLQLNVCAADEEDEDFGDFMGPDAGIGDVEGLSANHSFPRLSEALGETQSVASLELPGLEMTVGLQSSEFPGSGQSPDLFSQASRNETCVEDQLRSLTLDSGIAQDGNSNSNSNLTLGNTFGNGATSPSAAQNNVLDSFGSGLVDKYSIIREEASKNTYDEAHTGSWQRCLEGSIRLMEQAKEILGNLSDPKLKSQVLATSQMQDYLANLQEVWFVCERITSSSQQVTTSTKVDELLTQAKSLWEEVKVSADVSIPKMEGNERDNQMSESEVCGVCLSGGGSKLTYGGHSYHPPCANLWLNCVDLLLPSLTPVTLL